MDYLDFHYHDRQRSLKAMAGAIPKARSPLSVGTRIFIASVAGVLAAFALVVICDIVTR